MKSKKNRKLICAFVLTSLIILSINTALCEVIDNIFVKEFKFEGNTVFSDEELNKIANEYAGKEITYDKLNELRNKLTIYYVQNGFINSGVIIPDQAINNGVITFKIIEGTISNIEITGNEWLRTGYVKNRLKLNIGPPFNINSLQDRLLILHQDPLIDRMNTEVRPGINLGEGILKVKVEEARPYHAGIVFKNDNPPSSGANTLESYISHQNITGWGDSIELKYGFSEGVDDLSVYYQVPLTARDTILAFGYSKGSSDVIEEPFDAIDIEGKSENYEISLSHPIIKKANQELIFGIKGEKRHSSTYLLGFPYSFSKGANDGTSRITVIRFYQNWTHRGAYQVLGARSVFSTGIKALGATDNPSGPDGQFFAWLGQFQSARKFEKLFNIQIIIKGDLQLASVQLLNLEKYCLGGITTVRGYRENQLVRDNAAVGSMEMRLPITKLKIPKLSKTSEDGMIYFAPFVDYGYGWNKGGSTPDPKSISSVGTGLRWDVADKINAFIY
ncbi:MAG: ShlB/FhaC/HecB family hemolysin secretion/activation protein, partial [Desulfobacterales bacterium]|nr:ShlB/FhaC/HecB family hemolysin secretion/activation protein [Desulfobacterales bacterium]